jgi:hypothetical protein
MQNRSVTSKVTQLALLGCAAVVASCATQPDEQPAQFQSAPVLEAVYARDNIGSGLGDVQVWANAADPHYPTLATHSGLYPNGESGAQNTTNISPFPNSYGAIVVEFNTVLDGSKLGKQNDLGSYCSSGTDATTPFKVVDIDHGSRVLKGSICYDPTSPLYRYPNLVFILGADTAVDPSANPFTCQDFSPSAGDDNGAAFSPSTKYGIVFNTSVIQNQGGKGLALPAGDAAFSSGTFTFTTSGFDIMAAGYQDQNSGYFTFVKKPYLGFLKDLSAVGDAYLQPADNTLFFVYTTMNVGPGTITATRADGSDFGAKVTLIEPRVIQIKPGLTWEPGQKYIITVGGDLVTAGMTPYTISAGDTYSFSAAPGSPAPIAVAPIDGAVAQLVYGKNGAGSTKPSYVLIDFNVPIDPASATTDNVKVTAADGTVLAGTVVFTAHKNNQRVSFKPTDLYKSSTVYTVTTTNLVVQSGIPNFAAGTKVPDFKSSFTTSTLRTSAFLSVDTKLASADRTSNQPLTTLADGILVAFSRMVDLTTLDAGTAADPGTITINELSSTGADAGTVDPSNVLILPSSTLGPTFASHNLLALVAVAYGDATHPQGYPIKCKQKYQVVFHSGIVDIDEATPAHLTAEGCKTGNCPDIRTFTSAPLKVADGAVDFTPAAGNVAGTLSVTFNASLDHTIANPIIAAGVITLTDSAGTKIPLTCSPLADDQQSTITCTINGTLNPNSAYTASFVASGLKIATQAYGLEYVYGADCTTDNDCTVEGSLGCDTQNSGTCIDPTPILADQNSCTFAGSVSTPILTACPPATTPRQTTASAKRAAAIQSASAKKALQGPLASR